MASYRARLLAIQAASERALAQLFRDLAAGIAADVTRAADAAGVVPRSATFELQRRTAERIQRLYLGRNRAGVLAPFEVGNDGRVVPLSPYPQALWASITAAVRLPVEENASILLRKLPADILDVMRRARVDPFKAAKGQVAELEAVFRPNPLANYEAPHNWVDPNGYRLSDRIWNTAATERARLDAYLDDAIKRGTGALAMARELEQFLDPSRNGLTTNMPYGKKASYDAMRLARTEITHAHYNADLASGAMNPFVAGLQWMLSNRHPRRDICDDYAKGGPAGDGVYTLETIPQVPHPQCVTPGQMVSTASGPIAIEDIKAGDQVLTHMGRYRQVLSTWATPHDGLVYRFETDQGGFEVTGNHPVLLRSGWVNAEFVEPGDEILYASVGVSGDSRLVKADDAPAGQREKSRSANFATDGSWVAVPAPIALDPNANRWNGDIDEELSHLELFFVNNAYSVKGEVHSGLQRAGAGEPLLSASQQHGHKSWVRYPLGFRYFSGDIGAPGGVIFARQISRQVDPRHGFGCFAASAPVVFLPTGSNGVTPVTHGDIAHGEDATQNAVRDSVFFENLVTRHPLADVDFGHQIGDIFAGFGFESACMELGNGYVVDLGVSDEFTQTDAADGANQHYSLLSLDPESGWGARSGNLVVNRVITPVQAPHDYSRILTVSTCQYVGNVYNMTVADDHSYTVGGHVVHNCICHRKKVLRQDSDAVIDALRDDIRKARAELVDKVGPVQVEAFDKLLLGEQLPITQQGTRADELQSLRDRLTFTADENLATELAALGERIRAATNDRALLQQLTEERSVYLEILREREQRKAGTLTAGPNMTGEKNSG